MNNQDQVNVPLFSSSDPRVAVGRYTYGIPILKIWSASERISIGSFCSISEQVTIFAGGEHNTDWVTTYPLRVAFNDELALQDGHPATKGATVIGNDVWIGHGATILSGVTIGDGAVIGACSVVTGNVPPYAIVAGNPAKFIRSRFSQDVVDALCSIQWWNWDEDKIKACMNMLCSPNIDDFIKKFKKVILDGD